jgi:hypothetical protein
MLASVTRRRSSDSASPAIVRRQVSFNALMTAPTRTNTERPRISLLLAAAHEPTGSIQKY